MGGLEERVKRYAKALGFDPVTTSPDWDHETLFQGMYRRWRDLMCDEGAPR